jgi:hypothetical protein
VISHFGYKLIDALKMERLIIQLLQYKLDFQTSRDIMVMLVSTLNVSDIEMNNLCYKLLNFIIEDVRSLDFSQMEIATAIVSLAADMKKIMYIKQDMRNICGIKTNEYMNCYIVMKRYYILTLAYTFHNINITTI